LTPSPSAPEFPNLLVLSGAVPETRLAGSLLLYRLLQNYPAERLCVVGPRPHPESELLSCNYAYLRPARSALLNLTRLAALKRSFEAIGAVGRIPDARVDQAVGAFRPDVVVSVMERHDYAAAAYSFCRRRGVPLVVVVHDRLESFELVYPGFRAAQLAANARIYQFAVARLCVSGEMVDDLERVYGARGTVLYPNRSEALTPRPVSDSVRLKSAPLLTLGYAGSLAYGYGTRIRQVMPALVEAQTRLRVYSYDRFSEAVPGVVHGGTFPSPELWQRVKGECDAVWLPYSHDAHFQPLYRTHFPSKLAEYMVLGMPVLITGPAYATGVKWGANHADAVVTVPDDDISAIREAVVRLREEDVLRIALAAQSRGGDRDFDPVAIRGQFLGALREAAGAGASGRR